MFDTLPPLLSNFPVTLSVVIPVIVSVLPPLRVTSEKQYVPGASAMVPLPLMLSFPVDTLYADDGVIPEFTL